MTLKDLLGDAFKDEMSLEDVTKALESIDLPSDNSSEIEKLKAQLSSANSEAANYKKQLREKMSEDERKAADQKAKWEEMENELAELKKKDAINQNKTSLLALGYDEALAEKTASAMFEGDLQTVIANQKIFLETREKNLRAELLKGTPKPSGGGQENTPTISKEDFEKMSYSDMLTLKKEHPEIYDSLIGGKT